MTDDPIVPRPEQALAAGIEELVSLRPRARGFIDVGRYGNVFAAWRAQLARLVQRVVREIEASRLETASGDALRDLCASEFDTSLPTSPLAALGDVQLVRGPRGPAGVIPAGSRFRRAAKPTDPLLPRTEATYQSTIDVFVPAGDLSALVPIVATRPGAFANTPVGRDTRGNFVGSTDIQPADTLFDRNFQVQWTGSAGGSDGPDDALLKAAASAYALGRAGPTTGALVAAALLAGAAHVAVLEDATSAWSYVLAMDSSWATASTWRAPIQAAATAQGFGCRARLMSGFNTFLRVAAAITLRDPSALGATNAVGQSVTRAVDAYFRDRPDWYTWRVAGLKAACTRAHPSIKSCSSIVVTDAQTGAAVAEPPVRPSLNIEASAIRWALAPGAVQTTFTA